MRRHRGHRPEEPRLPEGFRFGPRGETGGGGSDLRSVLHQPARGKRTWAWPWCIGPWRPTRGPCLVDEGPEGGAEFRIFLPGTPQAEEVESS